MARYRVTEKSWLDFANARDPDKSGPRLVQKGEEVRFDGWPGSNLEPLDDEAKETKTFYDAHRNRADLPKSPAEWRGKPAGKQKPAVKGRAPDADGETEGVEIADDWRATHPSTRRSIAMKLGAEQTVTAEEADKIIETEVERRRSAED